MHRALVSDEKGPADQSIFSRLNVGECRQPADESENNCHVVEHGNSLFVVACSEHALRVVSTCADLPELYQVLNIRFPSLSRVDAAD